MVNPAGVPQCIWPFPLPPAVRHISLVFAVLGSGRFYSCHTGTELIGVTILCLQCVHLGSSRDEIQAQVLDHCYSGEGSVVGGVDLRMIRGSWYEEILVRDEPI